MLIVKVTAFPELLNCSRRKLRVPLWHLMLNQIGRTAVEGEKCTEMATLG
jgi:hypothetical protein